MDDSKAHHKPSVEQASQLKENKVTNIEPSLQVNEKGISYPRLNERSLRCSTRIKQRPDYYLESQSQRPDYYLESQSQFSSNIEKGKM